jgi:hypothetical protein
MRKTSKTRAQIRPGGRSTRCLKEDWTAKEKSNREMKTENRSDVFDGEEIETHWCGRDRVLETKLMWNLNSKYRQQDKRIWEGEEERPALNPNWDLVTISSNREKKTDRCQQNQQGKMNRTHKAKSDFSIALRQDSYTTEVTVLPPSHIFNWNWKTCSWLTPKLEMQNKIWEVTARDQSWHGQLHRWRNPTGKID